MITKLYPTDLIAVEVPIDATEVQVWNHGIGFKAESIKRLPDDTNGFFHLHTGLGRWSGYEILGEINKDEISFDIEPYVGKKQIGFRNYCNKNYCLFNKNESFRSLLQSNGLYWVNPIEKEPSHLNYKHKNQYNELVWISESHKNKYCDIYDEWQEAESKLIKGKLIILKPIL